MPTLSKLLTGLAVTAAIAYGVVYALATLVTPEQRDMSAPVLEKSRLDRK